MNSLLYGVQFCFMCIDRTIDEKETDYISIKTQENRDSAPKFTLVQIPISKVGRRGKRWSREKFLHDILRSSLFNQILAGAIRQKYRFSSTEMTRRKANRSRR